MKEIVCEMDDDVISGSLVTWNGSETRCVPLPVSRPWRRPYAEVFADLKDCRREIERLQGDVKDARSSAREQGRLGLFVGGSIMATIAMIVSWLMG